MDALQGTNNTTAAIVSQHQQIAGCSTAQCGQACVSYSPLAFCFLPPPGNIPPPEVTFSLRDTAGVITRLNGSQIGTAPIVRSLRYTSPGKNMTVSCPYIQYSFYNRDNLTVGASYIMPGQTDPSCIIFASGAVAYSGVTMLVPPPDELLGGNFLQGVIDS